jgi:hypothetical protein
MKDQNDNYNLANMLSKAEKEIEKIQRELVELKCECAAVRQEAEDRQRRLDWCDFRMKRHYEND